jgi:hypothetical protein
LIGDRPTQRALDCAEIEARGAALDALRAECAATSATLAAARADAAAKSAEAAEVGLDYCPSFVLFLI